MLITNINKITKILNELDKHQHYKLEVNIKPKPYYRMTQKSKFVDKRAKAYLDYKDEFAYHCKDQIEFYLEKGQEFAIVNIAYVKGGVVGDNDNYLKSTKDALNKVAWYDDKFSIIDLALRLSVPTVEDERTEVLIIKL